MKSHDSSVKTILVVEDEPAIAAVCRRVLTDEGFEIDIVINGKIAQDMIKKKRYGHCLIDIHTPEMNGIELFRWLQDSYPEMAKGVIFTTGDVMGGETNFIENNGMPFLPKPFTPDELRAVVRDTKQV